jgi:Restriction endonuclease
MDKGRQQMTWKEYEDALLQRLRQEFFEDTFVVRGTEAGMQHRVMGRFSLINRQLDVGAYRLGESRPFLLADAKKYDNKVDVKDVEMFLGMMDDVGAEIGLIAAPNGASEGAKNRARAAAVTVMVMSFEEAVRFKDWLPLAATVYPHDWAFHAELGLALRNLHGGKDLSGVIVALEAMPFEEWSAFVGFSSVYRPNEAVSFLRVVAEHHPDDGWRFNAIQRLDDLGQIDDSFRAHLLQREPDPDVQRLLMGEAL